MKKKMEKLLNDILDFGIKLDPEEKEYIKNQLILASLMGERNQIVKNLKRLKK